MSAPTDLELMMLLDGELDGERRAEVESYLAGAGDDAPESSEERAAARGKLAGLRSVSRVVSSFEWPAAGTDVADLADRVMAALPAKSDPAGEMPARHRTEGRSSRRPANDNSRAIFGFAIAAAAAAAALFFWGKTGDEVGGKDDRVAMTAPPVAPAENVPSPSDVVLGDRPVGDLAPEIANVDPADEPHYGVEVASVDFGARTGAIYYVPSADLDNAAEKAVTTVVWLNDD